MDTTIIGELSLGALLLLLISAYLNHLLANTRDKIKRRLTHGEKVIEAFKSELRAGLGKLDSDISGKAAL